MWKRCTPWVIVLLTVWRCGASPLDIEMVKYARADQEVEAVVVENGWYRALLVPTMGGRIVEWVDKSTGRNLVYDEGYGGLLDDHGARLKEPYALRWLIRNDQEAVAELLLEGEVTYRKRIHFHADRPALRVVYHVANHGQEPHRMLFRNVVRPAGETFSGDERYGYSRVVGLQEDVGMGRTDDLADPWMALISPKQKTVVGAAFRGDQLARVYTWQGSKVAPTFEFMLQQLEAGYETEQSYTWLFCHGLTGIDYLHSHLAAQWTGAFDTGEWQSTLKLVATWEPIPKLQVAVQLLDQDRRPLLELPPVTVTMKSLDQLVELPIQAELAAETVIAIATLTAPELPEAIVIEKAFSTGKLPESYQRPVRWIGEASPATRLADWQPESAYEVRIAPADRERGCMVYGEAGADAGRHMSRLRLNLGQREYESFPLHFLALSEAETVTVSATGEGLDVEFFLPEEVPETLWGRTYNGLKLMPGTSFTVQKEAERQLYVRLYTGELPPGQHRAGIVFSRQAGEPVTVQLELTVHPVRTPLQPYLVFDASNVVNYLAARRIKGNQMEWDWQKAERFLRNMQVHGVRGQSTIGTNTPVSYYEYDKLKLRESGQPLLDAIRENPERFRDRLDLPDLDFSEYDMLTEQIVRHGNTHLRWPMGSCGEDFMRNQIQLTKLIYGEAPAAADLRQQVIQEWYFRQVGRYFKDRGITRLRVTIDDEIPSEELAWWVQHAYRAQQMGFEPSVTQSAATMADDQRINFIAPFMTYWIVGTLHEETIAKRRMQGIIKPEHWFTTYHSSANHWQPYDQMRGHCGLNAAYFDLNACWIQTYYRWKQSEAVIYYTEEGPIDSAAWEGARDGLEDGNYLLLARRLVEALPADQQPAWQERIAGIVGRGEGATIRFVDRMTGVGPVTTMGRFEGQFFKTGANTDAFRTAKQQLLELIDELAPVVPRQAAAANYGLHPLIRDGKCVMTLPEGMTQLAAAQAFLREAAAPLIVSTEPAAFDDDFPYPLFFIGSLRELQSLVPKLAAHPDLADLDEGYPAAGEYAIRWLAAPANATASPRGESLVIVCPDEPGVAKAVSILPRVVTQPRSQYSHWLVDHWAETMR